MMGTSCLPSGTLRGNGQRERVTLESLRTACRAGRQEARKGMGVLAGRRPCPPSGSSAAPRGGSRTYTRELAK